MHGPTVAGVSIKQGVVAINQTAAQVQTRFLEAIGMENMLQVAPLAEEAG